MGHDLSKNVVKQLNINFKVIFIFVFAEGPLLNADI